MINPDGNHDYRHFTCAGCGGGFDAPVSCGNRFCSVCQGPRRQKIRLKLNAIIESLRLQPGYGIKFLTLTIPNQKEVKDATVQILHSFRRLRQRSMWRNKVAGGAWIVEITGKPGSWHVHLHCLLEARYIPHTLLSKIWSAVSPGKIVYISKIPAASAILYVTKYVSKPSVDEIHSFHVSEQLKDTRLFQPFGSWHAVAAEIPSVAYVCPNCGASAFFLNRDGLNVSGAWKCKGGSKWDAERFYAASHKADRTRSSPTCSNVPATILQSYVEFNDHHSVFSSE